jgi:hypothetical protein
MAVNGDLQLAIIRKLSLQGESVELVALTA